jgi:hypothetical protein
MLRLARAPNVAIASLWVDMLRQAGFDACLNRYFLGAAAGELPPDQCLPEVWLRDVTQEAAARDMLRQVQRPPQRRWTCACGEEVEGGFASCWQCGLPMPA